MEEAMSEQNEQEESAEIRAALWIKKNRGEEAFRAFMRKQLAQAVAELRRDLTELDESRRKLEEVCSEAADAIRAELKGLTP
jgi:hypothetical protein